MSRARLCARMKDEDICLDMRKLNGSQSKAFDMFFEWGLGHLESLLDPKVGWVMFTSMML